MFSSRDRDEIFMQIFTNEDWLRKQAESIGYKIQLNPGDDEDLQPKNTF